MKSKLNIVVKFWSRYQWWIVYLDINYFADFDPDDFNRVLVTVAIVLVEMFRCRSRYVGNQPIGGADIDDVVLSTFTALIWHTQNLRDELSQYGLFFTTYTLSDTYQKIFVICIDD